MDHNKTRGSIS